MITNRCQRKIRSIQHNIDIELKHSEDAQKVLAFCYPFKNQRTSKSILGQIPVAFTPKKAFIDKFIEKLFDSIAI